MRRFPPVVDPIARGRGQERKLRRLVSGVWFEPSVQMVVRLLVLLAPVASGFCALHLGQDTSWDLRNYHYYNPYAFLTGRMGVDIAVAHVATYYNPLLHVPFYWAVNALPPRAVGFLLGAAAGLNAWLLYLIARQVIVLQRPSTSVLLSGASALAGVTGAMNLAELGTSYADNLLSLPILMAVWLVLRFRHRLEGEARAGSPIAAAAGLLTGAALGLKLPFAIYAVGLCAAFLVLRGPLARRATLAISCGVGVVAGAIITGAQWGLEMWRRFGNPVFPYFNEYFESPWASAASYRDPRFLPEGLSDWLLFPFYPAVDPLHVAEVPFTDLRFPLLYVVLVLLSISLATARLRRPSVDARSAESVMDRLPAMTRFSILFMVIVFVAWMALFAVYRYLTAAEMLAPLVALLGLQVLVRDERRRVAIALAGLALLLVTAQPADWGRRPWGTDYFGVEPPAIAHPERAIVLMAGYEPSAYMIPFFPRELRFLRVEGYFTGPTAHPNATDRLMRRVVAGHPGDIFVLYRDYEAARAADAVAAYGLEIVTTGCATINPWVESQRRHPFHWCGARRISSESVLHGEVEGRVGRSLDLDVLVHSDVDAPATPGAVAAAVAEHDRVTGQSVDRDVEHP